MKERKRHSGTQKLGICLMAGLLSAVGWTAQLTVRADQPKDTIAPEIYGHFAEHLGRCIYDGIWVGENSSIPNIRGIRIDVLEALKALNIPVLRWPGGCFADEYHWREGIGPREKRPPMVNTHWGMVTETNAFGTHEFLDLCELLGCRAYVAGNVGSGTVEEMQDWVEYMTFDGISEMANLRRANGRQNPWKVRYFGIGNENWGCGGNMTPEYYSNLYRNYATYCRNYGDNRLQKIAGGANSSDYNWTEVLMKNVGAGQMWGLSLHHYTVPKGWGPGGKGSATQFSEDEYITTMEKALFMDELITKHTAIMDKYDPRKRVAFCVDEWGAWYDVEPGTNPGFLYQQNTLRDALLCATTMNIFHKHSDRVRMANIAQMVNVLQAIVLTKDDKMVLTPTYHIYNMYKVHHDATNLPIELLSPSYTVGTRSLQAMNVSASMDANGVIHVSIVNLDPKNAIETSCKLGQITAKSVSGQIVTAKELATYNSFEKPNEVVMADFKGAKIKDGTLSLTIPAKSVVTIALK